jgi:hypothetical protein
MFRDGDAMRLLDNIPSDLKVRGWRYSYTESSVQKGPAVTWYDAVYIRRFESDIDDAALAEHPPHNSHNQLAHVVRVSTLISAWSKSWTDARDTAIALMRAADAKRQESTQTPENRPRRTKPSHKALG